MTVEQRLSCLERQLRWLKRLGALALAVGAVVVLVAQAKQKEPQDLVVRSLKVLDESGQERARLDCSTGNSALMLWDAKGKIRVILSDWPAMSMHDERLKIRAQLGFQVDGSPRLNLFDRAMKLRVCLGADKLVRDETEVPAGGHDYTLALLDANRKVIWKAPGE